MTDITNNSNFLEGKPRQSTTLRNLINSINQIIQNDLIDAADNIEKQSSILTATGIWLDYIGNRFLFPRPLIAADDYNWFGFDGHGYGFDQANFTPGGINKVGIDDEAYRSLLIVRGGQLITDGTIPSLNATLDGAFDTGHYIDNGDMTMDVIIDSTQPDIIIAALVEAGLITRPAGVNVGTILLISHGEFTFGFDGNGVGFDQGLFVRTIDELAI